MKEAVYNSVELGATFKEGTVHELFLPEKRTYYVGIGLSFELQTLLQDVCSLYPDVPFELALSVIWKESLYRNTTGDGGESIGYMQIKEKYQKERMRELELETLSDPMSNFLCGVDILNELYQKYGDWHKALICYNYGEAGAREHVFSKGLRTTKYSRAVVGYMEKLLGG